MDSKKERNVLRVLPLAIAAAFAANAAAEERLEEVIVTAQKRSERLIDVPISMSAISGSQLETRGIEGAARLDGLVPNVTVKPVPGQTTGVAAFIRGIGVGQPAIWADPSIGLYVDGVFVGKNQGALFELLDLERVEVLRGPQGTLFGRNTEGGAINFITRKPTGEFGGNIGIEIGNHNRRVEKAAIDLPKMGIVSINFAVRDEKQDGWLPNPNGDAWGSKGRSAARFGIGLDVSPAFKVNYAFDHTHISETPTPTTLRSITGYGPLYPSANPFASYNLYAGGFNSVPTAYFAGPLAALLPLRNANMLPSVQSTLVPYAPASSQSYPSSLAGDPGKTYYQKLDVDGHSITASYQINPNNTLKYIGSYRKMHLDDNKDLDGTPLNIYEAAMNTKYRTWSQELQWIGNTERMNYVLGYYLFRDDGDSLSNDQGTFLSMLPAAFGGVKYNSRWLNVTTDAKAVYGQIDYKLTDALTGTLGLRHTQEDRGGATWATSTNANFDPPGSAGVSYQAGLTPQQGNATFSASTPVLALNFKASEGLNFYGRIAKGFKSGGFPVQAPVTAVSSPMTPYEQEKSTSYEAGIKSQFWGGRAQVNAAVFRTDVTNFQISELPPGSTSPTMVNTGKARYEGLEVEGSFVVSDGWKVQVGYGYLNPKLISFILYNPAGQLADVAANTTPVYAPKNTLTLSVDGRLAQTSLGTLRGIIDFNYTSSMYNYSAQRSAVGTNVAVGNSAEESNMPATAIVNARLLLAGIPIGGPGKADVSLWVRNLTDVKKLATGFDLGGMFVVGNWTEPRTAGLSFNYKW